MALVILDIETGEMQPIPEGTKINLVTPNTREYLKTLNEYEITGEQKLFLSGYVPFRPDKNHVKVFTREFKEVSKRLSGGAVALLMLLMPYARMGSNVLWTLNQKYKLNSKYIIDNISPFGRNKTLEIMRELKDKVIIIEASDKGGSKQYVMNPYIYFKGKYINQTILDIFAKYERKTKV